MAPPKRKDSVDRYFLIDVREVAPAGVWRLKASSVTYSYDVRRGREWEHVTVHVPLSYTRCNYGGARPWFVCTCGRRVGKLYLGRTLGCRTCLNLSYPCQSETRRGRMTRRQWELRGRLGGGGTLLDPFPTRPRYMHMNKYLRLLLQDIRFGQKWAEASRLHLERMIGRKLAV